MVVQINLIFCHSSGSRPGKLVPVFGEMAFQDSQLGVRGGIAGRRALKVGGPNAVTVVPVMPALAGEPRSPQLSAMHTNRPHIFLVPLRELESG